jgi:hypothetical protein
VSKYEGQHLAILATLTCFCAISRARLAGQWAWNPPRGAGARTLRSRAGSCLTTTHIQAPHQRQPCPFFFWRTCLRHTPACSTPQHPTLHFPLHADSQPRLLPETDRMNARAVEQFPRPPRFRRRSPPGLRPLSRPQSTLVCCVSFVTVVLAVMIDGLPIPTDDPVPPGETARGGGAAARVSQITGEAMPIRVRVRT